MPGRRGLAHVWHEVATHAYGFSTYAVCRDLGDPLGGVTGSLGGRLPGAAGRGAEGVR
jgi:hypothetical protein